MLNGQHILNIGCDYRNPKGGIAMVQWEYSKFYRPFNHVSTTRGSKGSVVAFIQALIVFLKWMIAKREIEIVHIHTASNHSFYRKAVFVVLSKLFRKKVVMHVHGGYFKEFAKRHYTLVSFILRRSDAIVALSPYWKTAFEDELHCKHVFVIGNVIPKPIQMPKQNQCFTLLFLGALNRQKGIYDLLDVLCDNYLAWDGNIKLLLCGEGDIDKVESFVATHKMAGMVSIEGWVSGKQKSTMFCNSSAFVLPSYVEGQPLSIYEAMSYKLPIISTTVGGIPEMVHDGENGYLITAGDKAALATAINALLKNPDKASEMGAAGYNKVKAHFPDSVSDQLSGLYESLLVNNPKAQL